VPAPGLETAALQAPAVMLRDPELDALMAAHQQMGGHSAWQMPSGFLRNATYERPVR
jgi:sigma-E factor negative regulatory protein RseA